MNTVSLPNDHPLHLPLCMPLRGWQVIEASAGTGKTWTLAALYLRLVLGHGRPEGGLLPPSILVMTFTDAATAELRERIRARLSVAAQCFDAHARGAALPTGVTEDDFTRTLRESIPTAQWPACALQLSTAADWMDEAAIHTIHGWCHRMLSQHALASGRLFEQTHLEDARELQRELVQDYWRHWFYPLPANTLQALLPVIGATPDDWLARIQERWAEWDRSPGLDTQPVDTPTELVSAVQDWQARLHAVAQRLRPSWTTALLEDLNTHRIPRAQAAHQQSWVQQLQAWVAQAELPVPDQELRTTLQRFSARTLRDKSWPRVDAHPFLSHLDDYLDTLAQAPDIDAALLDHAAHAVAQTYAQAKQQRGAFDFQDLLRQLHDALARDDDGARTLAATLRAQYPVALVDEFQDTDPWQYGSLRRIYDPASMGDAHLLVMIGDPKQAIYRFRGADLHTYLQARELARAHDPHALHTLQGNHRSSAPLLRAIEHLFTRLPRPFHLDADAQPRIDYVPVQARAAVAPWQIEGEDSRAMTVWWLPMDGKAWNKPAHLAHMAEVFASQMARLWQRGLAEPGQMAVLVRQQAEADAMRAALRAHGMASVYLSERSSVYQTPEATDLWRVLRALASPRDPGAVRSALACALWALPLDAVSALLEDEARWETLLMQCHDWHQRWQSQGVMPMLHHWLHHAGVAQRLLSQREGEARIARLLHLGELLQQASVSTQGPLALVRWLAEQIAHPPLQADAQKMRLETDAQCVQVITYHKSKGLQFPLVFVPYLGSFAYNPQDDELTASVEEDVRLIYVALTRAERALWLGLAETTHDIDSAGLRRSAVSHLLQRQRRGDLIDQVKALWGDCPDIRLGPAPDAVAAPGGPLDAMLRAQPDVPASPTQEARTPRRVHPRRWWTASFSALARGLHTRGDDEPLVDALLDALPHAPLSSDEEPPNADTAASASDPATDPRDATTPLHWQDFPAGARYGTLLHDLLQWQAEHDWPLREAHTTDPHDGARSARQRDWQALVERRAQWLQLDPAQRQTMAQWLARIVATPLPLTAPAGGRVALQDLTTQWAEMEFNLPVHAVRASQLDALVQAHLFPGQPRAALQEREMQGMLNGFMDLVFEHGERYWVLDYKSNLLPDYGPQALTDAVLGKRYEVQYTLYVLALHRLLRARLPGYDYDQHMGGAVYVFLRGIDTAHAGVHAQRLPRALIDALDAAFEGDPVALPGGLSWA